MLLCESPETVKPSTRPLSMPLAMTNAYQEDLIFTELLATPSSLDFSDTSTSGLPHNIPKSSSRTHYVSFADRYIVTLLA